MADSSIMVGVQEYSFLNNIKAQLRKPRKMQRLKSKEINNMAISCNKRTSLFSLEQNMLSWIFGKDA